MIAVPVAGCSPTRHLAWIVGLGACLAACDPSSLDYLKNGQRRDGSARDQSGAEPILATPNADARTTDSGLPEPDVQPTTDAPERRDSVDGRLVDGGRPESAPRDEGSTAADTRLLPDANSKDVDADGTGGTGGRGGSGGSGGALGTGATGGGVDGNLGTAGVTGTEERDAAADGELVGGDASVSNEAGVGGAGGTGGALATGGAAGGAGGTAGTGGSGGVHADASPDSFDATPDSLPQCAGVLDSGVCWYLGRSGDSCASTCSHHGGTSAQAARHVGTSSQGGSAQECRRLLDLLGIESSVSTTTAEAGLGCVTLLGNAYWLSSPAYSESAKLSLTQLVCGCLQ